MSLAYNITLSLRHSLSHSLAYITLSLTPLLFSLHDVIRFRFQVTVTHSTHSPLCFSIPLNMPLSGVVSV